MKKLVAFTAAAALLAGAAFADGLKVSGYVRGGVEADTEGKSVDFAKAAYQEGDNYGAGTALRVNVNYEKEGTGVKARFQGNYTQDDFFAAKTIKYAYGYGKAFDGKVEVQAGKLYDFDATTDGYEGGSFGDIANLGNGLRLLVTPVEGLQFTALASDVFAEKYVATDDKVVEEKAKAGDIKANEKLFGFTAKYTNDLVSVAGGYHLANAGFGGINVTPVEGANVSAEAFWDKTGDSDDSDNTIVVLAASYANDKFEAGVASYITLAEDAYYVAAEDPTKVTVIPYASYSVTDALTAYVEGTYYVSYDTDAADNYFTVSPAVELKVAPKATVTAYGLISSDTDIASHKAGVGYKFNF